MNDARPDRNPVSGTWNSGVRPDAGSYRRRSPLDADDPGPAAAPHCPACGNLDVKSQYGGERGEAGPFMYCPACDYDEEAEKKKAMVLVGTEYQGGVPHAFAVDQRGNLPCPFCGGMVAEIKLEDESAAAAAECKSCGALAPTMEIWNTRQHDDPVRASMLRGNKMWAVGYETGKDAYGMVFGPSDDMGECMMFTPDDRTRPCRILELSTTGSTVVWTYDHGKQDWTNESNT